MRYTFKQFKAEYPDDDACLEAVFQNRFGDLKYCPKCGAVTKFYRVKKRQCYACMHCSYQLFPLAATIFRKSRTSLWNWFFAIYLFSTSKNGVSAKELERHLGVTYKTAWRMANQIRKLMADEAGQLSGTVEVDETFIGSRKRGTDKPVVGMAQRKGGVRAKVIARRNRKSIIPEVKSHIAKGSNVMTDEFNAYDVLGYMPDYNHATIKHYKEYARGDIHTNNIEGFWSQLKRSIDGTYHVVSPKYLQSYVNEFAFRYSYRNYAVYPVLLERVGTHV